MSEYFFATLSNVAVTDKNTALAGLPEDVFVVGSLPEISAECAWSHPSAEGVYTKKLTFKASVFLQSGGVSRGSEQVEYSVPTTSKYSGTHAFSLQMLIGTLPPGEHYLFQVWVDELLSNGVTVQGQAPDILFDYYTYAAPAISAFSVARCNSDGSANPEGTSAEASASFAVSAIGGANTKSLTVRWREYGTEAWSSPEAISISALEYADSVSEALVSGEFDADKNYDIQISLTDLVSTATRLGLLAAATTFVDWDFERYKVAFHKNVEDVDPPDADFGGSVMFRQAPDYADPASARAALGIKTGIVSTTLPNNSKKTGSVTFDTAYASAPIVMLTLQYNDSANTTTVIKLFLVSATTTGFTWSLQSSGSATNAAQVWWVAIGTPV